MTIQSMLNWRNKSKNFVRKYKTGKHCVCCGYNEYIEILHFHHIKNKSFDIGSGGNHSITKLKEEIKKCILLCPNCHALLHHRERLL